MPVPLNAVVEITRCWFSKKLGYHTDTSIPVRPSRESVKATTPMDIDLICTHPKLDKVSIPFEPGELPKNLLVECKGWFEYPGASYDLLGRLSSDIELMKGKKFVPKTIPRRELKNTFLKEEVYEKGKEIFGSEDFGRVLVCPHLHEEHTMGSRKIRKGEVIETLREKGVFVIEIPHILNDLIRYLKDPSSKDYRRKDFVLELLHLVDTYSVIGPRDNLSAPSK